jgi:UDP-N-acetylmuramoyl-tripeptide--D-alanyl-D-alanine ligase
MFQLNSYSYKEHIGYTSRRLLRTLPLTWLNVRAAFKAKKPLVFTSRVKRLIFTEVLLLATVLIIFNLFTPINLYVVVGLIICIALAFCIASPFVFLANFLNAPLEAAVRHYYIRDAKKILRTHPDLIVVGITGSYGKTSTKNYVAKLLSAKYNVLMTPASYNTPMGICMTIRTELRGFHDVFVVEMGAKKRGEIAEICRIIQPDIGILTSIGPAHLETFGSLENTVKTKYELVRSLEYSPKELKLALINGDSELLSNNLKQHLPSNVSALTFGRSPGVDVRAHALEVDANGTVFAIGGGLSVTIPPINSASEAGPDYAGDTVSSNNDGDGTEESSMTFKTPLVGAHNLSNLSAAIALARHLGIHDQDIAQKLQRLSAPEHRLELKKKSDSLVILDDAYNSNPSGAKAALDVLELMQGVKIVVTPGMVELGSAHVEANFNFGREIAKVADFVCLVGPRQTKPIQDGLASSGYDPSKLFIAKNVEEGINKALEFPIENDQTRFVLLENDLPDNYKE